MSDAKNYSTEEVLMHLDNYYGDEIDGWKAVDFLVQEKSRYYTAMVRAKMSTADNGHESMIFISELYKMYKDKLSPKLRELIETGIASKDVNLRGHVAAIWTFPRAPKDYMKWISVPDDVRKKVIAAASFLQFDNLVLHAVRGQTIKIMVKDFTKKLWANADVATALRTAVKDQILQMNTADSHMTLVNSAVLANSDEKKFNQFFDVERKLEIKDVEIVDVKHSVSLDWAPFWLCVVVVLRSKTIDALIDRINKEFGVQIKPPSIHITVATADRYLVQ